MSDGRMIVVMPDGLEIDAPANASRAEIAKRASVAAMDQEFLMEIARRLGPTKTRESSPSADNIVSHLKAPDNLTVRAIQIPANMKQRDIDLGINMDSFSNFGVDTSQFKAGTIHTFGPGNTQPATQAHEVRHELYGQGLSEQENRLLDAWNASTPEEWDDAVHMWHDQLKRNFSERKSEAPTPTIEEAEEILITLLQSEDRMVRLWQHYLDPDKINTETKDTLSSTRQANATRKYVRGETPLTIPWKIALERKSHRQNQNNE